MSDILKTEAAVFSCRPFFLGAFPFISFIYLTTAGNKCLCGGCKMSPRTTSLRVIICWSSGIIGCTGMLFTFENTWKSRVPLMRFGASVEWHQSLPLMNSFNKNRGRCFFVQAMPPEGFLFHQFYFQMSVCAIHSLVRIIRTPALKLDEWTCTKLKCNMHLWINYTDCLISL